MLDTLTDIPVDLMQEQLALEQEMLDGGLARVMKEVKQAEERGDTASTPGARYLIRHLLRPVSEALDALIAEAESGKAGRRHSAVPYLAACGSEVAAYIALRTAVNSLSGPEPVRLAIHDSYGAPAAKVELMCPAP